MTPLGRRALLREVARRTTVSIAVGCVVPGLLFYSLYLAAGVWPAVGAALGWTYGALAWRRLTGRPVSGLLVLAAVVLTVRSAVAFAADNPFVYFLQPVLTDLVIGAVFLASLLTSRPVVARLAPDFYPLDDDVAARPGIRRLFAWLTVLWAAVCLAKGTVMLWLLTSQSIDTYVLIRGLTIAPTHVLAVATTVTAAMLVAKREGLLGGPVERPHTVGSSALA